VKGVEHALAMEKEAERYYRDLAEKAVNPGLKSVFLLLAEEEARHHDFYSSLGRQAGGKMKGSNLLSAVKQVFLKMRETKDTSGTGASQAELYKEALEAERHHYEFYLKKAEDAADETGRKMFRNIAAEEKRHALVLEKVLDFVSRPTEWLENAEWYHLEDY
jgi:rubrerythrin